MKLYLVVYEESWSFDVAVLKSDLDLDTSSGGSGSVWSTSEKHHYSRLRSMAIKAENKIDAFNKAKSQFQGNQNIVHIESLSDD